MNERIRQLSNLAYDDLVNQTGNIVVFDEDFQQRFAELIVLECVNAVMDGTKEGEHYAMRIENHFDSSTSGVLHFGVEER